LSPDGGTFFLDEISELKPELQAKLLIEGDWPGSVREPANELEREAIERALALVGGNRRAAAERLGIGLRTLYDKLKRYGLE
jgi:two-component system response regulator FlrC